MGVGYAAEGAEALEDLGRVLGFVQVDGQEAVVGGHAERGLFAGAEEVRDVLHLDKGHGRLLELDRAGDGHVDEPVDVSYSDPARRLLWWRPLTCIIRSHP